MSRSAEFGKGTVFTEKDQDGNETTRNAIEAVGGKRDGNQARMLPPVEKPEQPWAGPSEEEWQREIAWSRSH